MKGRMESNGLFRTLPHLSLVLGVMMIALNIANYFNGSMGFLSGDVARLVMLALSVAAIANALVLIRVQTRDDEDGQGGAA